MNLPAELKHLAGEIDPAQKRPRFRVSTTPWPEEHAGETSYVDVEGVLHFTLTFDRRDNHEPAKKESTEESEPGSPHNIRYTSIP